MSSGSSVAIFTRTTRHEMPHIPMRHKIGGASKIALLGSGIVLIGLLAGITVFRGYYLKGVLRRPGQVPPRTISQVPEPASVRSQAPDQRKMNTTIIAAWIGFAGAVLAATIGVGTPGSPTSALHSPRASHFTHEAGGCRDDGRRGLDLWRPRAGESGWPVHSSCPQAPQWDSGAADRPQGVRSALMTGRAAVLAP